MFVASKLKSYGMLSILLLGVFTTSYLFADDSVVGPIDFVTQVMHTMHDLGGLSTMFKISALVMIVISSMKVSILNRLFWSKLGNFQSWLAPILGIVVGIISLGVGGAPITVAGVFTYLTAGAGAIILHELLDTVKAIPGLGDAWVQAITSLELNLGGPASEKH